MTAAPAVGGGGGDFGGLRRGVPLVRAAAVREGALHGRMPRFVRRERRQDRDRRGGQLLEAMLVARGNHHRHAPKVSRDLFLFLFCCRRSWRWFHRLVVGVAVVATGRHEAWSCCVASGAGAAFESLSLARAQVKVRRASERARAGSPEVVMRGRAPIVGGPG